MTHPTTTPAAPTRPRRRAATALAVGAVLALGLAACGGDDDTAATDTTEESGGAATTAAPAGDGYDSPGGDAGGADTTGAADAPAGGGEAVAYEVSAIQYTDVAAPAGGTIEVSNSSGAPHTFTADDGAFDVAYEDGETATVEVPAEPGDYAFHCEIHPNMAATVTAE